MEDTQSQSLDTVNRVLAPAAIFAAVTAWFFQQFIMGSDLFWHLAAGRDIWERGAVPRTDPFSHTFGGKPWTNHEWLWDVIYWKIYQIGPDAVAWFTIGIYVVIFTLVFMLAYEATKSMFAAGLTVWLATIASHWFLDVRPHPVTLLMAGILLVTRHKKWALWMWPPLIVLWTNLHAGFVFGIGMVGLLVLVRTIETSFKEEKLSIPWAAWASVALCLVIWMVNPYGPWIAEFQLDYFFKDSPYRGLVEWNPPLFGLNPYYFEGTFWWIVMLAAVGACCGRSKIVVYCVTGAIVLVNALMWLKFNQPTVVEDLRSGDLSTVQYKWLILLILTGGFVSNLIMRSEDNSKYKPGNYLIALTFVTFFMACGSRRFIPLFCITAAPLAATCLVFYRDKLYELLPQAKSSWVGIGATVVTLTVAYVTWSEVRFGEGLLRDWAMTDRYPEDQVAWLNEVQPDKRVLNYYNWGGFIILNAPGYKLFFDGRANTLYGEEIYHDYHRRMLRGDFTGDFMKKYPADVALLSANPVNFHRQLTKIQPPWELVHRGRGVLLLPPDSPLSARDLPTVEEVVPDGIEAFLARAKRAETRGDTELAIDILNQAMEKFYYDTRVYNRLAQIYARDKNVDKIIETFDRGVEMNPRRSATYYSYKAQYLKNFGRLEEAIDALNRAHFRGPFGSDLHRYSSQLQVKQLQQQLEKRKQREKRGF